MDTDAYRNECWSLQTNSLVISRYESARDGIGITVSYWKDIESIKNWKANSEHQIAQKTGKEKWYESFVTRICKLERDYGFERM